ncbi:MAG: CHC2 zinc finger domain-containing protein [Candidatus Paceibacterota bacterium]
MDTVDLVKEKIDIADLVGEYVRLTQAGKNFKGLCPFHQEKSPSFVVSPDRQMWHCFGCAKGGDVISFLMQYENIEFIEALKILADKAGVNMQLRGSQDQKKFNILFDINALAARYYHASLKSENAKAHYEYAKSRGLTDEIIDEFRIGVSSENKDSLVSFLSKKGFAVQDIERAGLAVKASMAPTAIGFVSALCFHSSTILGK